MMKKYAKRGLIVKNIRLFFKNKQTTAKYSPKTHTKKRNKKKYFFHIIKIANKNLQD